MTIIRASLMIVGAMVNLSSMTYGRARTGQRRQDVKRFLPHYVLFDGKTLRFDAYFKQGIFGSADEHFRVRKVQLMYYLEDDTMAVLEKPVDNAGFKQGKLVRRSRIPRPDKPGTFYHWKDLNVAANIEIYGIVYRTVSCDGYTREFLTSQGIDVNDPESMPVDPYLHERALKEQLAKAALPTKNRQSADRRFMFLEYQGLVLTFDALWNDEVYKVRYFLDDDTMSVAEPKGPLMLRRTKVPKDWRDMPVAYLERTDEDVKEFYAPIDLKIGETIFIFGRRFFLYDCDRFTRKYYADVLRQPQPEPVTLPQTLALTDDVNPPAFTAAGAKREERAKDTLRRLYNFPKKLRYSLAMEAVHPEDEGREFVLEYDLSSGNIRILEKKVKNSGRMAGCFLGSTRVPKPGDEECYYTPEDFWIGARLKIFGHWFVVTETEPFVYQYMEANPEKFNEEIRRNVREHLIARGFIKDEEVAEKAEKNENCEDEHLGDLIKDIEVKKGEKVVEKIEKENDCDGRYLESLVMEIPEKKDEECGCDNLECLRDELKERKNEEHELENLDCLRENTLVNKNEDCGCANIDCLREESIERKNEECGCENLECLVDTKVKNDDECGCKNLECLDENGGVKKDEEPGIWSKNLKCLRDQKVQKKFNKCGCTDQECL